MQEKILAKLQELRTEEKDSLAILRKFRRNCWGLA